jgi:hypothetical protein
MLSEFSISIKYDHYPNYYKFSTIPPVYLNILGFHNNASMVDGDTKSRIYKGVIDCSAEASGFCLNPVFRHCDPMEACAHGVSTTGMKPS